MPTKQVWISGALPVAQVATVQITGYDATTTYKITIGGVVISVLGTTDAAGTATALKNALAASTHPYFTAITWTVTTDTVKGTAVNAGIPFVATSSVSGGAGTIGSVTAVTASSGPNDFATAANWRSGAVPADGDSLVITGDADILWSLDQSAKTFTDFRIDFSYSGKIGLFSRVFQTSSAASDSAANEYRTAYLTCGATICNIFGGGGRIKLNFSTLQTTCTVFASATSATDDATLQPVRLLGTHASNELNVLGGSIVGVATEAPESEVATFALVSASGTSGTASLGGTTGGSTPQVFLGTGCTLTTLDTENATIVNLGANVVGAYVYAGGVYTAYETCTHTTIECWDGTLNYLSNGTITNLYATGTVDFSGDTRTKIVTNCTLYEGATLNANTGRAGSVTFSNGLILKGCKIKQVNLDLGTDFTLTPSGY